MPSTLSVFGRIGLSFVGCVAATVAAPVVAVPVLAGTFYSLYTITRDEDREYKEFLAIEEAKGKQFRAERTAKELTRMLRWAAKNGYTGDLIYEGLEPEVHNSIHPITDEERAHNRKCYEDNRIWAQYQAMEDAYGFGAAHDFTEEYYPQW